MAVRASKALAAWQALNDRQQGTLAVVYELDHPGIRPDATQVHK